MISFIPEDIITSEEIRNNVPKFFEIQVKTVFQHAWGEANHDLGYKPDCELTEEEKRKMAFAAAQAWGSDQVFSELFESLSSRT